MDGTRVHCVRWNHQTHQAVPAFAYDVGKLQNNAGTNTGDISVASPLDTRGTLSIQ